MSDIVSAIHSEHGMIMRILGRLEQEIERFERGRQPDFEVLKEIADYFLDCADPYHHAREDILYDALVAKVPEAAETTGDLRAEHAVLARQAETFSQGLASILMEVEISRPAFVAMARNFIARQKDHVASEEKILLPLARAELNGDDLAALELRAREKISASPACEKIMTQFKSALANSGRE